MMAQKRHSRIEHWDDERSLGNSLIVTLKAGWRFSEVGEHVQGFDSHKEAMIAVRGAHPCHCPKCEVRAGDVVADCKSTKSKPPSQYDELDRIILLTIANGRSPLYAKAVQQEAARLEALIFRDDYRIVDGRLQALRRRNLIEYVTKVKSGKKPGWRLVKSNPETEVTQ